MTRSRLRSGTLATLLAASLLAGGCSGGDTGTGRPAGDSAALSSSTTSSTGGRAAGPASSEAVTKLLVVVEENHSLAQMQQGMPYSFRLAKKFGYATDYRAVTHPSLPNYLAIASGSTHGVRDDLAPLVHPLSGATVFDQALAAGRTAGLYAQSMPSRCDTSPSDPYAVKHNPWAYFTQGRTECARHDRPMSRFGKDATKGRLPNVGMVIPDLDHDAHDGSLAAADAWFEAVMRKVFAGEDWQSGHLAVVLTADEDDRAHGNRVLTVVIHPSQRHHVVRTRLSHYSLTRLYEDVAGVKHLHHAKKAPSMSEAFGLPVAGASS